MAADNCRNLCLFACAGQAVSCRVVCSQAEPSTQLLSLLYQAQNLIFIRAACLGCNSLGSTPLSQLLR